MKIGLISDTHGVFDPAFRQFLDPVDELWHAGDWGGDDAFVRQITEYKPVVGVYGNCDSRSLCYDFSEYQFFTRENIPILMTHIGGYPGRYSPKALALIKQLRPRLFVCGHSHILKVMYDKQFDCLTVNPGACGIQGWHLVRTALRFDLKDGKISGMEVFELPRAPLNASSQAGNLSGLKKN